MAEDKPGGSGLPRGMIPRRGGSVGRLPSIRTPRDLTLGGVRKKQFAPTIPVRKKKTDAESAPEQENTPRSSGRKGHERKDSGRGRGRGRGRGEVVQSHSIFEQGPCERLNKGRGSVSVEGGERSTAAIPRAAMKREKRDDPDTKRVLDDLLRDDFIDDKDIDPEPNLIPVKLPMVDRLKIKKETDVKPKIKVKEEPPDDFDMTSKSEKKQEEAPMEINDDEVEEEPPETCAQLFNLPTKSEAELILIQLPDCLPGHPPLTEEDLGCKKKEPGTSSQAKTDTKEITEKLDQCTLRTFPEGYMGKLQIHKSGKAKLVLGNVKLDVSMGMPAGFLQDLVSVRVDPETEEGDMITLGHVQHKFVCTPDFDNLMSKR